MMNRSPDHVLQFTLSELGTEGSIDGNQRLVIRGRYVPKVFSDSDDLMHICIGT